MMKRWIKGISLALAIALMSPQAALAARGPGVGGETAGSGDTSVRLFPGWNGAGTISPMISTSPDEFDGPDDDDSYPQGWRYSPSGWWYQYADGGWPVNGWKYIDSRWYFFNADGHAVTGWIQVDGNYFYMNPVDDGTFASMRTGWQIVDGKAYYLNTRSDGTLGKLLMNTTTPDGYKVGADGAMIP
ncbi:glucan-binding protein [Hungatella hathewayi]|nr:glucan-binding protein [Hungatella hathewayi]